jgi:hypothetical protein
VKLAETEPASNVYLDPDRPPTRPAADYSDLEAIAAVTPIMAGLDAANQRRVAAFVARKWGTDA